MEKRQQKIKRRRQRYTDHIKGVRCKDWGNKDNKSQTQADKPEETA
jgi:hypothetical protein